MEELKFDDSGVDYWFTSDSHYWHKNIVKGESDWSDKSGCRDFKDRREMSTEIVDQINKHVMPDDILFHLGDWSFGGIQNIWNFRKRINCKNIYLCTGNHDHHIKADKELPNVMWKNIGSDAIMDDCDPDEKWHFNCCAQELFTDVQPLYEIMIHGQRMTLCHYAMLTYYFHNKGAWMLYGHSHDSLTLPGRTLDVGLDTAKRMLGEYRPFKFQELQKILNKKEISKPDHHNNKTNP